MEESTPMINGFHPYPPVHGRPWGQNPPAYQESNHVDLPGFFVGPRQAGLDLVANGKFDPGRDAVLAFDLDRNGTVTQAEVQQSHQLLAAGQLGQLDRNGDGRLNANEFTAGGGQVLIDRNHDGYFGSTETYSAFNIPAPGFPWR